MKKKNIYTIAIISAVLIITSCTPKSHVFVQPSGDVVVTLDIKSSELMDSMLGNFGNFSEQEKKEKASIFDAKQIKTELQKQGLKVLSIETNSLAGIKTKFKIYKKQMESENSFVKTDMKKGLLSLSIGPKNINEFVKMLSEEDREYIDLLMAPVFTNEDLNEEEYIEQISAFGATLANELKLAKFSISVTCPKTIKSIEIKPFGRGTKNGNKAYIEIPLTKILCVKEPIFAEVKFRP